MIEFCSLIFNCDIVVSSDMFGKVMRPSVTSGAGESTCSVMLSEVEDVDEGGIGFVADCALGVAMIIRPYKT